MKWKFAFIPCIISNKFICKLDAHGVAGAAIFLCPGLISDKIRVCMFKKHSDQSFIDLHKLGWIYLI